MESNTCFSSQQALCRDVELGKKEDKARYRSYQCAAIILSAVLLIMALGILSLRFVWRPGPWKVYDHHYTALLDGKETESMMEIDPVKRMEMFQMGNGTDEVIEVHDFKNGIMGIRFAKHQRCYIRAQTKKLPVPTEVHPKDDAIEVNEQSDMDMQMEPQIWIPAEEPISNNTFLLNSKIWEICQKLPIHWIHPSPLKEFSDIEDVDQIPELEAGGARRARDVMDQLPVNDYRDVGLELDNRLDEQGYCCQYCRRGYRYCRRYYEPLGGYSPYPYFYQGGRVICQIVMPCDWWIARMLGRI